MRIAITGSKGQLGTTLLAQLEGHDILGMDLPEHDLTNLATTRGAIQAFQPKVIIHTAAMTNVDLCESQPELAYRVNVAATRNLAVAAQDVDAALVYISTDYIYDGDQEEPYWEYDDPNPLSVYGRTKLLGEDIVRDLLNHFYIVRVAWLYSTGPRNFVRTVLRLADERGSLSMVTDEVGSPTFAEDVAVALEELIQTQAYGIYQLPNGGCCSRYEWTAEILRLAGRSDVALTATTNYQRAAAVPAHAEMRNFMGAELGIIMRPWQEALADCMHKMGASA